MATMITLSLTLTLLAGGAFGGFVNELAGLKFCEPGWLSTTSGYCVLPVSQRKSWTEARDYCSSRMGRLHNPAKTEMVTNQAPLTQTETQNLGQILFQTSVFWWSGMYIDPTENRLMWNNYLPEYVIKQSWNREFWQWEQGETFREGKCGQIRLGSLETQSTTTSPALQTTNFQDATTAPQNGQTPGTFIAKQYDNSTFIKLAPCETLLPFVCQKDSATTVSPVSTCEPGWVGNALLSRCYKMPKTEMVDILSAQRECANIGGFLTNTTMSIELIEAIRKYYVTNDTYFIAKGIQSILLQSADNNIEGPRTCVVYTDFTFQSCGEVVAPFICHKAAVITKPAPVDIHISSIYLNQALLSRQPPELAYPISGRYSRHPADTEQFYVKTPVEVISILPRPQNFYVSSSLRTESPFFVNITRSFTQSPARRRRSWTARKHNWVKVALRQAGRRKRQIEGIYLSPSDMVDSTGYYQFGYYSYNHPGLQMSSPVLIRYSEQYLLIYVAYLTAPVLDFGISLSDIESFNLLRDDSYVFNIFEYLGSVFYGSPRGAEGINLYTYKLEHINASANEIKVRYFVTFGRNNVTIQEEQAMLSIMKQHLSSASERLTSYRVFSTVACPSFKPNNSTTFTFALAGETRFSWERCYGGVGAKASAPCLGGYDNGARWGPVTYNSGCSEPPTQNSTSNSSRDLKNLSESKVDANNYVSIINETVTLTSPDVNLTSNDVIFTADILYNQWQSQQDVTPVIDNIFSITNNILATGDGVVEQAHLLDNAANRIIRSVEELTTRLKLPLSGNVSVVRPLVAADVRTQTGFGTNLVIGLSLSKAQSASKPVIEPNNLNSLEEALDPNSVATDAGIYLRRSLIANANTKLAFQIYGKTSLFSAPFDRYKINSKVAAAKLFINGEQRMSLDDGDVTAVFTPITDKGNLICGFWNYSANQDAGGWSVSGCTTTFEAEHIVCKCNHLTNFAVLIDLEADRISGIHEDILGIITMVGLIISICCLGLTIITFLLFKHLRSGRGQQVLINLCVAILCSAVIFLVGIERTDVRVGCKVVAALLHYFILVSFMWMLVEGLLQYLRFVKVLGTYIPRFMLKTMIPAWGLPLIPVIVCLAIDHEMYYTGDKGYCWLQYKAMLYAFLIPVAVVILANIIVFLMVMCRLMRRKNKGISNQSEKKMAMLHFQAGVSIFVVLGLTWVFGFFALTGARIVFHYLFAIFNAFQGFFIFLLFTLKEKKIRAAWRKKCCGRKAAYKSDSGTHSNQVKKLTGDTNSTGLSSSGGKDSNSNRDYPVQAKNPNY